MSYFKAKMYQIRFRLGLCPDPAGEAYNTLPDPLAGFKGSTCKEGMGGRTGGKGEGEGRGDLLLRRVGEEGKEEGVSPPNLKTKLCPCSLAHGAVTRIS